MKMFKIVSLFVVGMTTVFNVIATPVTWSVDALLESNATIQESLTGSFTYDTSLETFTNVDLTITDISNVELFSYRFASSRWGYNIIDFFESDPSNDLTGVSWIAIGFNPSGLLDYSNAIGSFPVSNFQTNPNYVVQSSRQTCLNASLNSTTCQLSTTVITVAGSGTLSGTPTVPIPAAVWLFGSGLLGFIGIARRKKGKR